MDDSSDSFSPADTSSQSQAQAQAQAIVQDQGQAQAQSSRALAPRPSEDGSGPAMSHAGAAGTPSAPKKRPAQASRGVSTMTPERLARKRANDREAQRAVRERTRAQIRGLQDEVLVLKGDQAQLQQVLQHNSALQAENEAMKTIVTQLVQQLDAHTINPHASQPHHQHQHEHHHQHQHQHQHQHHHHHHHQRLQHHQRQKMQQQQQQQQQQHNNFTPSASSSSPDTSLRESSESSLGRLSSGQSSVSNLENMNGSGCGANRNGNGGFGANSAANTVVLPGIAELTRGPFASDLSGTPGSSSFRPRDQNPSNFERLDLQFPAKNQHGQGSFAPQQLQQHYPPFNDAEPRTSSPRAFASSSRINLSELSRIAQVMPPISAFERPSPPMVHALNSIDASMITMGSAVHFTSNQSDIVNDVSTPMSSGEPSNVNGNGSSNGSSNGGSGRNGNGRSNQDNSSGSHNSFESPRTNNSSIDIDMSNNSNGNGNGNGNNNGSGSGSNGNTSNNGVKNINGKRVRSPHSGPLKSPVEILDGDGDGDGNNLGRSSSNSVKLQILHITSTCKIDTHLLALFSLQDVGHAMQPEIATLLAPATVSYSSLRGKLDPISATLSDIIASFETFQRLPERVAMMYASFLLVKYLVNPSPENLARVPGFMRPSEDQCQPHAAWIDLFPFPHARAKLVRDLNSTHNNQHNGSGAASPLACNGDGNSNGNSNGNGNGNSNGLDNGNENGDNFGRFFETYLSSFSIGWPYEDTDVLLLTPNRELIINPVFDRHIRRLENWTLGLKFRETYPEFSHLVNLRDEN